MSDVLKLSVLDALSLLSTKTFAPSTEVGVEQRNGTVVGASRRTSEL